MSIHDLVMLRGRAGSDVTLYTPEEGENKRSYARFRLAVPRSRRRDDGTWEDGEAQWYTVHAWGALADNAFVSVRKGFPVVVVGRPNAQAWLTKEGELRSEVAINARTIGLDLVYGISIFRRSVPHAPSRAGGAETTTGNDLPVDTGSTEDSPQAGQEAAGDQDDQQIEGLLAEGEDADHTDSRAFGQEEPSFEEGSPSKEAREDQQSMESEEGPTDPDAPLSRPSYKTPSDEDVLAASA